MADKKLTLMSIRAYARHKTVSHTTVRKARVAGTLSEECFTTHETNGRPMIYKELADIEWSKNYNSNYTRTVKGGEDGEEKTNHETISGKVLANTSIKKSLSETKQQINEVDLRLKLLTLKERQGELVNKAQVYNDLYEIGKQLKTDLQVLPDRILDDVRAFPTREEAHALFFNSLNEILERMFSTADAKRVA